MYIFPFFRFNNNQQLNMEDMLWKFPHVGADVFKKLSNKNLAKCKKVARTWECFINNERFCKERVKYELIQKKKDKWAWTPLHHAVETGQVMECKLIIGMQNCDVFPKKQHFDFIIIDKLKGA